MPVVINELDLVVEEPPRAPTPAVPPPAPAPTARDIDDVARHLEARRARVRAD
ncbi:MAG: hypothetical protein AB7O29_14720 [Acidimicrobiia bacterium]